MQFIAAEVFICSFDCKAFFVCVKDRTCLRMAAYCFCIFGSIFGALFCLLIKKIILECGTIWQSMRNFLWAFWSVSTSPHMDKEEKRNFFLENCTLIWPEFLIPFHQTWKFEIEIFWKFSCFRFSERKGINFYLDQMIYVHPLTLNYPLQYAERLSNIIAR